MDTLMYVNFISKRLLNTRTFVTLMYVYVLDPILNSNMSNKNSKTKVR